MQNKLKFLLPVLLKNVADTEKSAVNRAFEQDDTIPTVAVPELVSTFVVNIDFAPTQDLSILRLGDLE